jgi:hypothetical protein
LHTARGRRVNDGVMRWIVMLAIAGCSGVSSMPAPTWDEAAQAFADAHCRWYYSCGGYTETGCIADVVDDQTQTRMTLPAGEVDACIDCMQLWASIYESDTSPCVGTLTFDQQQQVTTACGSDCFQHDLPGDGRFGP